MDKMSEVSYVFNYSPKRRKCRTFSKAGILLDTVSNFQFLVSLVVTRNILDYIRPATVLLQRREIDILEGYNIINTLIKTLNDTRTDVDSKHEDWYNETLDIANSLNIEEKMPRIAVNSKYRENNPSTCPSDYYKKVLTIPALDHMIKDLPRKTKCVYRRLL